jgi:hypothetical protein
MGRLISPTPFRMQVVHCPGGDFWLPEPNVYLVFIWWYQHIPRAETIFLPVGCQCKSPFANGPLELANILPDQNISCSGGNFWPPDHLQASVCSVRIAFRARRRRNMPCSATRNPISQRVLYHRPCSLYRKVQKKGSSVMACQEGRCPIHGSVHSWIFQRINWDDQE